MKKNTKTKKTTNTKTNISKSKKQTKTTLSKNKKAVIPGEIIFAKDDIVINADREAIEIIMKNTGDRPIQIGSHFHLYEVNSKIDFYDKNGKVVTDRSIVWGMRFDIPSGTAIRFEPNEKKSVNIIPLKGTREVYGLDNLVDGKLDKGPKTKYSKNK